MANDWFVQERVLDGADAVFLIGGDQMQYRGVWNETDIESKIESKYASNHFVLAGSSAGLHILGGWDSYTAIPGGEDAADIFYNPIPSEHTGVDHFNEDENSFEIDWTWNSPTLSQNPAEFVGSEFLNVDTMAGILTESHFEAKNRMPRFHDVSG